MTLIKKILVTIKSLYLTVYYLMRLVFFSPKLEPGNNGYVVSLTSYGSRVKFSFLTIESIFQQSFKPDAIVLWLYKNDKPRGVWLKILQHQERRGLTVRYVDRDVRSYKKLSFILDDNSLPRHITPKFIVTADDDIFYPENWMEGFNNYNKKNEPAVLCYRGRNIIINKNGRISPYDQWSLASKMSAKDYTILPTGVSGICYPIKALDNSIALFDEIAKICPYADDIWYKMVTTKNNFDSRLIVKDSIHFVPVFTGFTKGLEKFNVINKLNDNQFIASMDYFMLNVSSFMINKDK
ncbi:hypothetical protein AAH450_02370 [Erwinia sp. P7711]|uniref:hypothetical protein n=1 Tax=Erwinia sp. P7711 TaxID=3141451 RepID=UPI003186A57C